MGTPTSEGYAREIVGTPPATVSCYTSADVSLNLKALGQAVDPLNFGPGSTTFNVDLSGYSLSIGQPDSSGFAESDFLMTSTIPGLQSLVTFNLGAAGQISTSGDVGISFTSNPLLGLNDSAIQSELQSAGVVSPGQFSLAGPVEFSFTITSDQAYSVDDYSESYAVADVPEPSTLALVGSGVVGLLGYAWRKRRAM
jgi:hypothetical protein